MRLGLFVNFIVDGYHLSPATVKSMVVAKSPSRSIHVTDATAAASCPPGRYTIGATPIESSAEGRVSLRGVSRLAGSSLAMNDAVANAVRFTGLELAEVLPMASTLPARFIGTELTGRVSAEWDPKKYCLTVSPALSSLDNLRLFPAL
jgi:N-acetylglucosamine-6-phosphate deacetylase